MRRRQKVNKAAKKVAARAASGYPVRVILAQQIRAARGLLGWTQTELAKAAGVSRAVVNAVEQGTTDPRKSTVDAIEAALQKAGVVLIPKNGGGVGVRLRK